MGMFHLNTLPQLKQKILADLGEKDGRKKIVFCSSSLSMGMNLAQIEYVVHYGPSLTAEAFFQETGRAGREVHLLCHSILLTYPRMLCGVKPDKVMKDYAKSDGCLRNILLSKFNTTKPDNQLHCCMRCHPDTPCTILTLLHDSFESSFTETFSDSDSVASVASIESLTDM
jgi:superfamily II DNA helicase RecQ